MAFTARVSICGNEVCVNNAHKDDKEHTIRQAIAVCMHSGRGNVASLLRNNPQGVWVEYFEKKPTQSPKPRPVVTCWTDRY